MGARQQYATNGGAVGSTSGAAAARPRPAPDRLWLNRFAANRLTGLLDRPHRRPRLHGLSVESTILLRARLSPTDFGVADMARWTVREQARFLADYP